MTVASYGINQWWQSCKRNLAHTVRQFTLHGISTIDMNTPFYLSMVCQFQWSVPPAYHPLIIINVNICFSTVGQQLSDIHTCQSQAMTNQLQVNHKCFHVNEEIVDHLMKVFFCDVRYCNCSRSICSVSQALAITVAFQIQWHTKFCVQCFMVD